MSTVRKPGARGLWGHVVRMALSYPDGSFTSAQIMLDSKQDLDLGVISSAIQKARSWDLVEKTEEQRYVPQLDRKYTVYRLLPKGWDFAQGKLAFVERRSQEGSEESRGLQPVATWIAPLVESPMAEVNAETYVDKIVSLAASRAAWRRMPEKVCTEGNESCKIDSLLVRVTAREAEAIYEMNVEELKVLQEAMPSMGLTLRLSVLPIRVGFKTLSLATQTELGKLIRTKDISRVNELPELKTATPLEIEELLSVYSDYFQLLDKS